MTDNGNGQRTYRINPYKHHHADVSPIDGEFREMYYALAAEGARVARDSRVCFVGMARDIAGILPVNLERVKQIGLMFSEWSAVVIENDSLDSTKKILQEWAEVNHGQVIANCSDYGRERLSGFERVRVEHYAEYRTRYRDIAASHFGKVDYVIAVDLDPWGGWSESGVLNGLGWIDRLKSAAGLASVSLHEQQAILASGERGSIWGHYDQWAWRAAGWQKRFEPHFPLWTPPVGSPPIRCNSAFGALCIYRADPFFTYAPVSINGDIEHVGLHKAMADGGWEFYLNPSQRTLMNWAPTDEDLLPDDA